LRIIGFSSSPDADRQPLSSRIPEIAADLDGGVLAEARAAGVGRMLTISTTVRHFTALGHPYASSANGFAIVMQPSILTVASLRCREPR
jgi:hypothetical protein